MTAQKYTMPPAEANARNMIAGRTTPQLIEDWEEIDKKRPTSEVVVVRSFLMDELESRNRAAFDSWLESNEASPRKFFVV